MVENINWEEIAKGILQAEQESRKSIKILSPSEVITGSFVYWRKKIYIGSFQEIAPEISKEIILLAKSTYPLKIELINAIKKLDKDRIDLYADDNIDLDGRQHILRRVGNKLLYMTPSQTLYMIEHPPIVGEI